MGAGIALTFIGRRGGLRHHVWWATCFMSILCVALSSYAFSVVNLLPHLLNIFKYQTLFTHSDFGVGLFRRPSLEYMILVAKYHNHKLCKIERNFKQQLLSNRRSLMTTIPNQYSRAMYNLQ